MGKSDDLGALGNLFGSVGGPGALTAFPSTIGQLARYAVKPEPRDVWYNKKVVKLDGFKFAHCRFDGCTLIVTSANFELDHCIIDEATVIQYGGDIMRVVKIFTSRYQWAYDFMPTLAPTRNEDGTISITG